jgi:hypothetical protein
MAVNDASMPRLVRRYPASCQPTIMLMAGRSRRLVQPPLSVRGDLDFPWGDGQHLGLPSGAAWFE